MTIRRFRALSRQLSASSMTPMSFARKVAILGAAGGIGQPLSLLLKAFPRVENKPLLSHLALYDIANMGMSADLAHISTAVKVTGHSGPEQLAEALKGAEVVLIPAGVPRKPGMTRDDLFNINASIVRDLTVACAQAHVLVISNPVNATVPIAYETLKKHGISNPSVFGITTLDVVRARTFVAEACGVDPDSLHDLRVIGGHSGVTIIPLLSKQLASFSTESIDQIINRIQYGGDEVVKAKAGGGSATLSMAYAAYQFFVDFTTEKRSLIAYVRIPEAVAGKFSSEYFATEISANAREGLKQVLPMPALSEKESALLAAAIPELQRDIAKGKEFAAK